jgi:ABC-type polysaccharide/polyol phosphate export permease
VTLRGHVVAALFRREAAIARSYPLARALALAFGTLNLALYFFISKTVAPSRPEQLGSAPSYFAFAAAGVAIATVAQAATATLARRVREEQLTGGLEALMVQPVTSIELALGLTGFPFMLALARVIVYLAVAALLLGLPLGGADPVGVATVLLLAAPAFSGVGIAMAAAVLLVKRAEALVSLAMFALFFASGAYFPVGQLPSWLRRLAELTPTLHACGGLRAALYGGSWGDDALALALCAAATFPLACLLFACAVRRARRLGSLLEP